MLERHRGKVYSDEDLALLLSETPTGALYHCTCSNEPPFGLFHEGALHLTYKGYALMFPGSSISIRLADVTCIRCGLLIKGFSVTWDFLDKLKKEKADEAI